MTARDDLFGAYLALRTDLLRFLSARMGDAAGAEDLYHDLYLRLQSAELPEAVGEPRAFLYKMAYNLANDRSRATRRRATRDQEWHDTAVHKVGSAPVADIPSVEQAIDTQRKLVKVLAWIEALPPRCREVFTLHRVSGVPHQEIASRLKISTKAVEKHMANALRILGEKSESDILEGRVSNDL